MFTNIYEYAETNTYKIRFQYEQTVQNELMSFNYSPTNASSLLSFQPFYFVLADGGGYTYIRI